MKLTYIEVVVYVLCVSSKSFYKVFDSLIFGGVLLGGASLKKFMACKQLSE